MEKLREAVDYVLSLFKRDFWINRESNGFSSGLFAFWAIAFFVSQRGKALLHVHRDGIVNLGVNGFLLQEVAESVAPQDTNDILVENVPVRHNFGQTNDTFVDQAGFDKKPVVTRGVGLTRGCPDAQV